MLEHIDKLHTTKMGAERIKRNLGLSEDDVFSWCLAAVSEAEKSVRKGKNWYVYTRGVEITVNASSFTIITAHKEKTR